MLAIGIFTMISVCLVIGVDTGEAFGKNILKCITHTHTCIHKCMHYILRNPSVSSYACCKKLKMSHLQIVKNLLFPVSTKQCYTLHTYITYIHT